MAVVSPDRSGDGEEGDDGAGKNPQLVAWIEIAPAVMSQTAVRRRVTVMPLVTDLLRLRGFFFLGMKAGC